MAAVDVSAAIYVDTGPSRERKRPAPAEPDLAGLTANEARA